MLCARGDLTSLLRIPQGHLDHATDMTPDPVGKKKAAGLSAACKRRESYERNTHLHFMQGLCADFG